MILNDSHKVQKQKYISPLFQVFIFVVIQVMIMAVPVILLT
jgi:hypothetical protein